MLEHVKAAERRNKVIRFKEARRAANLEQPAVAQELSKRTGIKIDAPQLSRMESGKCLPTPPTAAAMCELYGVELLEMVDIEDITFEFVRPSKAKKPEGIKDTCKVAASIKIELASGLLGKLRFLGYSGITDGMTDWIKTINRRYEKKVAASGANTDSDSAGK